MSNTISTVKILGAKHLSSGKVREMFDLGDKLLIVTTDRISAFDVVLPDPIPFKGKVLNLLSKHWFEFFSGKVNHHMITTDITKMSIELDASLSGRTMLCKKSLVFPVECVVRGYITGSGWKDYQKTGSVCGIKLPSGLKLSEKLPEPIFTPATKAQTGHDENISYSAMESTVGKDTALKLKELSLMLYKSASEYALKRSIIIADTKFEFGIHNGIITLIDEALTPDSSRFWPLEGYEAGKDQPSFDKQFVRNYLEEIKWGKTPPAPKLPEAIISKTSEKYLLAYKLLTGNDMPSDSA